MAVEKIQVESGNPYRDDEGQFASPLDSGGALDADNDSDFDDFNLDDSFGDGFDDDDDWDIETDEDREFVKKTNSRDFWHTQFPRTVDEVFDEVEKFFDNDDVVGVLNRFNHDAFMPNSYGNSAAYGNNSVIINAIAKGQYKPMTLLSPTEFDAKIKERVSKNKWNDTVDWDNQPNSRLGLLQRGVNNPGRVVGSYLKGEGDLFLTEGACGHCVYTAHNDYTASGYGRKTLSMLIDNKQGKVIEYYEYNNLKQTSGFKQKMNDQTFKDGIKQRIVSTLVNKGVDEYNADRDARHFLKALENDENFLAVCMGYDCVYYTPSKWCLLLNFGNVYLRDDKPEFKNI